MSERIYRIYKPFYSFLLTSKYEKRESNKSNAVNVYKVNAADLKNHFADLSRVCKDLGNPPQLVVLTSIVGCHNAIMINLTSAEEADCQVVIDLAYVICDLFLQALTLADDVLERYFRNSHRAG